MSEAFGHVAVAGAGAFGTALALAAHKAGRTVTLWARDPAQAEAMRSRGENAAYLPGMPIPPGIAVSADPAALRGAELVLLAAPAQASRAAASRLAPEIGQAVPVLACAKGIEDGTGLLQTEIIALCIPQARRAVLSGPGFAEEIARALPTAVTIAAADIALAHRLCAALSSDTFRPYASADVVGVELGGAAKNVLAIACGIVAGRGLGESARAALIARGLAEIMRLGAALGARPETFMGLSGLGDIVLTATSAQSRNTGFGAALARGRTVADLMAAGAPLAEGAHTAPVIAALARKHGVDTPILAAIASVIGGAATVDEAIESLISRPLRPEAG